jgi:maltooligosyltrehalose trehalohydrolase
MRRGRLAVACNLAAEPAAAPFTGELVLCSDSPSVGATTTELQPYSFAILRAVDS